MRRMELYQEMENIVADFTISNENTINAEYSIEQDNFDCSFEIFAFAAIWGAITGNITDQTDLMQMLDEKVDVSQYEEDIEEINERIDTTLNNIVGSDLIGVERDNQTVTIMSKTFVYEQGVASNVWDIQHNLNKRPSIHLVDSTGREFEAEKDYISDNQVIIRLESATTGLAYLN